VAAAAGGTHRPHLRPQLLSENIRAQWQGMLLEQPPALQGLVDAYIQEATSFYLTTGTQTNLNAWLLEQIRGTPRYQTLYAQKPEGMTEDQYLGRYSNVAQQFGLRSWNETAQVEQGMSSGRTCSRSPTRSRRAANTRRAHRGPVEGVRFHL